MLGQSHLNETETWSVPLPDHATFSETRLKRTFSASDTRYEVVIVDALKLLACADRDTSDYVLPPVDYWPSGKSLGLRTFLDPEQMRIPEMPYVRVKLIRTYGILGFLGIGNQCVVSFNNGQHRARYLAFAGATSFPVEVGRKDAALLRRYCSAVPVR